MKVKLLKAFRKNYKVIEVNAAGRDDYYRSMLIEYGGKFKLPMYEALTRFDIVHETRGCIFQTRQQAIDDLLKEFTFKIRKNNPDSKKKTVKVWYNK